jgi:hypothetical protein
VSRAQRQGWRRGVTTRPGTSCPAGLVARCWLANISTGGAYGLLSAPPTMNSVPSATAADATPTAT